MLYSVTLSLESSSPLNIQMSSLFQGVLMEKLMEARKEDYIEKLHESALHEYSMYLHEDRDTNRWYWILNLLNDEAFNSIWTETLSHVKQFELTHQEIKVKITGAEVKQLSDHELFDIFKSDRMIDRFVLDFQTPVSFKRDGGYVIFPEIALIINSLVKKYEAAFQDEIISDEDTLNQLYERCYISAYKLRSTAFHLEGIRINSFIGSITISCRSNSTMKNFLNILLTFGEYSGIGIKTSIGMGAYRLRVIERKPKTTQQAEG